MITTLLKRISAAISDGAILSGHPELVPLEVARDFPDIERQLVREEWPFLESDLEISHAQPRATAFVARKRGEFAGFFSCHHFGDVGYLDMMIIDPAFRREGVARPLYFGTLREMKKKGMRGFVVHTTADSARLIRLIGFRGGQTFTLLARDAAGSPVSADPLVTRLSPADAVELIALDAAVFGLSRPTWVGGLLAQSSPAFFGIKRGGRLTAAITLRARRGGALCLDGANARSFKDLEILALEVIARHADRRLECFVKDGSALDRTLRAEGFAVPEFFTRIGPLVEWRKGATGRLGISPHTQCLSWF